MIVIQLAQVKVGVQPLPSTPEMIGGGKLLVMADEKSGIIVHLPVDAIAAAQLSAALRTLQEVALQDGAAG